MRFLTILLTAFVFTGCAFPTAGVRTGSVRPTLAVLGAPEDAVLYLDGVAVGPANQFDGRVKVLNIEEGLHRVEIRLNGAAIYSERFVTSSGETRTISVGGAK
jgi:hypothetical protein